MTNQELTGLLVRIRADLSDYTLKMAQMEGETAKVETSLLKRFQRIGGGLAKIAEGLSVPMAAVSGASLKLAMEAVESENLFKESFEGMSDDATAWSKKLRQELGLNEYNLRKQSGMFYVMFQSMGLTTQASYDMATGLTKLAYDMASFYDLKPEEAFEKLRAGITGEQEPLKRLGILVDEATTKTYAYQKGIAEMGAELTQQEKVLARYEAILAQTSKAQGDLARTMDSPVNKMRMLREEASQLGTEFGFTLIPLFEKAVNVGGSLLKRYSELDDSQKAAINSLTIFGTTATGTIAGLRLLGIALGFAVNPWVGLTMGILAAAAALDQYLDSQKKVDSYSGNEIKKVTVYDNGVPTEAYFKKVEVTDMVAEALRSVNAPRNEYAGWGYRRLSADEAAAQRAYEAAVAYGQETGNPIFNEKQLAERERERIKEAARQAARTAGSAVAGGGAKEAADRTREIENLNANLRDELMKLTNDDLTYKLWAIDQWVEKQKEAGADSVLVEQVAAERRKAAYADESEAWKQVLDKNVEETKAAEQKIIDEAERTAQAQIDAAERVNDAWASSLAGIASGTSTWLDFLRQQWNEFIYDILRANANFGGSGNILRDALGGLFDLSSSTYTPTSTNNPTWNEGGGIRKYGKGGPAAPNVPIIVGDEGRPEVFVPNTAGVILPNLNKLGGESYYVQSSPTIVVQSSDPATAGDSVLRAWPEIEKRIAEGVVKKPFLRNAIKKATQ